MSDSSGGLVRDALRDAWDRSKEHFAWWHPVGLALVAAAIGAAKDGWVSAAVDLWESFESAGLAVVLYAIALFGWNLLLAFPRVYKLRGEKIHQQDEVIKALREPRLVLSLRTESEAPSVSSDCTVCSVVVTNTSEAVSVTECSAVAESISVTSWSLEDRIKVGDAQNTLKALQGVTLRLTKDYDNPPARVHTLHGASDLSFLAVKLHPTGNLVIEHAHKQRMVYPQGIEHWIHSPPHALPPGEYVIVVKVQGTDVKPARIGLRVWCGRGEAKVEVEPLP